MRLKEIPPFKRDSTAALLCLVSKKVNNKKLMQTHIARDLDLHSLRLPGCFHNERGGGRGGGETWLLALTLGCVKRDEKISSTSFTPPKKKNSNQKNVEIHLSPFLCDSPNFRAPLFALAGRLS